VDKFTNMIDCNIGLWKVIARDTTKEKRAYWRCKCLGCGVEQSVSGTNLRGQTKVGGCKSCRSVTLAGKHPSEYHVWANIKTRVNNPNRRDAARYNNLGMYTPWVKRFELFLHAIGPRPSPKHSVDRIDNTKGYFPGNVRWATAAEQARNTSRNIRIKDMVLVDYAKVLGIPYNTLRDKYHKAQLELTGERNAVHKNT